MVMFNFGFVFIKKHLSSYGLYRIFLAVNLSLPYGIDVMLRHMSKYGIVPPKKEKGFPRIIQLVLHLYKESGLIDVESIIDEKFSHGYRPKKQCQTCSESHYHSFVYDLPWVKMCPTHEVPLNDRCSECGQLWPSISEIRLRECPACGVGTYFKELRKLGALNTSLQYENLDSDSKIREIVLHIQSDTVTVIKQTLYGKKSVVVANEMSKFIPQALHHLDDQSKKTLSDMTVAKHCLELVNFEAFYIPPTNKLYDKLLIDDFRLELMKEVAMLLAKELSVILCKKHELGQCQIPGSSSCLICRTWFLWNLVLHNRSAFSEDSFKSLWQGELAQIYNNRPPRLPAITCTAEKGGNVFNIPHSARRVLFLNDCFYVFIGISRYLRNYYKSVSFKTSYSWLNFFQDNPQLLAEKDFRTPLFVFPEKSQLKLIFPVLDVSSLLQTEFSDLGQ